MKILLGLLISINLLFSATHSFKLSSIWPNEKYTKNRTIEKAEPLLKANIQWGEDLNLYLSKEGFRTTVKGLKVFGSFNLKDEQFRSADMWKSLRFPLHNMLLVRHNYTIYILDLKKEEMIGQFRIPSRGTPRFVKIEPHENGYTSLKVMFRILPRARTEEEKEKKIRPRGRPGPLITKVMIYKDGKYLPLKRKGI